MTRASRMPMAVHSRVIWAKPRIGIASPAMATGTSSARATATTAVVATEATAPAARPDFHTGCVDVVVLVVEVVVGARVAVIGVLLWSGTGSVPGLTHHTNDR